MASSTRSITDAVPNGVINGENLEGDASDTSTLSSSNDGWSDDNASWVSDTVGDVSDFIEMTFNSENDGSDDESDDNGPSAPKRPADITPAREKQKPDLISTSSLRSHIPEKPAAENCIQSPTALAKRATLTNTSPVQSVAQAPSTALEGRNANESPEDGDALPAPKRPTYARRNNTRTRYKVSTSSQPPPIPKQPSAANTGSPTYLAKPSISTNTTAIPAQQVAKSHSIAREDSSQNESSEDGDEPPAPKRSSQAPTNRRPRQPFKVTTSTQLAPTSTEPATRKCVKSVTKDGTVWTNQPPRNRKTPSANILREKSGPKNLDGASTQLSLFELFMPDAMLQEILKQSNFHGLSKEGRQWVDITMMELRATLGLLLYLGLTKSGHENSKSFWRPGMFSRPTCQATMSGKRFMTLMAVLSFDDRSTRLKRKALDKFAPMREVFEMFTKACRNYFKPGECVTVDEQLVAFRGRCSFRQYMPRKPHKYGIKFWVCADSETNYVYNMKPYLGKQDAKTPKMDIGCRVVTDLVEPLFGSGRNVTADNFFISKTLAEYLLTKKLSLVGTVRENRREIPVGMRKKSTKGRTVKSSEFLFNGMTTLVSYVPNKNRNVTVMSTMHHNKAVISETSKPEIIHYYNSTKSGVDTVDQMCSLYNCARISNRWTLVVFFNMLNIAAINAYVLWRQVNAESCSRHDFLKHVITGLVDPQIKQRAANPVGMQRQTNWAMGCLGYEVAYKNQRPTTGSERKIYPRRFCFLCKKKTTRICDDCSRFACMEHCAKVLTSKSCCIDCERFPIVY